MKNSQLIIFVCLIICFISCDMIANSDLDEKTIYVSIHNSEIYEYQTGIGGDEEEASIVIQAKHFEISDIIRNAETNWEAVYKYKPKSGYKGSDYMEIELGTGSDGAGPSTHFERIKIKILVL
jgi:uncharacterized membrane protein